MSWWIICLVILFIHIICGIICSLYFIGVNSSYWTIDIFTFIGLVVLGPLLLFTYICIIFIIKIQDLITKLKNKNKNPLQ